MITSSEAGSQYFEVCQPPQDSVAALAFNVSSLPWNVLCAGSWDQTMRLWAIAMNGSSDALCVRKLNAPVLDVSWSDDGTKIYAAIDNEVHQWDLQADQLMRVGMHEKGVRTCHWIRACNYACLMTGSWDKTLKFWDPRCATPMLTLDLPERCFAADVLYPLAVVATACRKVISFSLDKEPMEFSRVDCPLKHQLRAISIFRDQQAMPTGYAVSSIEGRVHIGYLNAQSPTNEAFTFKCHRNDSPNGFHNIYAVNDLKFHPVHNTLATVGSDGSYAFWDKDAHSNLMVSDTMDQSITKCCINSDGQIFAYALGYDWSKGHEYNEGKASNIILRPCFADMSPKAKQT